MLQTKNIEENIEREIKNNIDRKQKLEEERKQLSPRDKLLQDSEYAKLEIEVMPHLKKASKELFDNLRIYQVLDMKYAHKRIIDTLIITTINKYTKLKKHMMNIK